MMSFIRLWVKIKVSLDKIFNDEVATNPRRDIKSGQSDLFTLLAGSTVDFESVVQKTSDLEQFLDSVAVGLVQPLGA